MHPLLPAISSGQAEAQRQLQAADSARSGTSTEPLVRCGMAARRPAVANVQIRRLGELRSPWPYP
jgi:hypothetical protein